jgi:putrescine importer
MAQDNTLKRTLGLGSLVIFGIAYMALSTVMTYMGITAQMTHGMIALAFLIAGVAMTFTAFSYAKMVRAYPVAGSAFAYASNSLNPHVGFMTGWIMMLDYALLGCLSYLLLGLYMNILIPTIPAWAWVIIAVAILTVVQYVGVDIMAKVNNILVAIVAVFMVGFFILMLKVIITGSGFTALFDIAGLYNVEEFNEVGLGGIVQAASILVLCFLGCDAVTTLAEEAIEPKKNVGRAIIIITVGMGLYFVIYSYVMQLVWPTAWMEFVNPDTASEELVTYVGGQTLGLVWTGMYVLTCVTCCLAAQTSASRLLFGMGRDGVLPAKFFAHLHPKFKTPTYNIIFISVLSIIVACFTDLLSISSVINFGALIGFAMVNVSVFAHYFVQERMRSGLFNITSYIIAPAIGAAVCLFIWINLDSTAMILGGCWAVVGFVYLAIATKGFKKVKKMTFSEIDSAEKNDR